MNSNYLLLLIGVAACFIQSAYSIRCYTCALNRNDPHCEHQRETQCIGTLPDYVQQQSNNNNWNIRSPASGCLKKTYNLRNDNGENIRAVEKSCFYGDIKNTQWGCTVNPNLHAGEQISCDVCDGELCNSSSMISPKTTIITSFTVLLMIFIGKLYIF